MGTRSELRGIRFEAKTAPAWHVLPRFVGHRAFNVDQPVSFDSSDYAFWTNRPSEK